jgi:mannose-1-phosphate guanylyltransferase
MLTTEATRDQSVNYGCVVTGGDRQQVLHYVDKPSTFISTQISCGIYVCTPAIFTHLADAFQRRSKDFDASK